MVRKINRSGVKMSKITLINKICSAVIQDVDISKNDMENSSICGRNTNYKSGIYFLYNDKNEVVYVGRVSNRENTSLYYRIVGHGSGSHKTKNSRWYNEVKKGKFHTFNGLDNEELKKIERLAIFGMNQPKYNDVDITNKDIESLLKKI